MKSKREDVDYGTRGSVRMDAYENRPQDSTACIYDPKTGKSGLSLPRMAELTLNAKRFFGANRIIVIEVRPRQE